MKRVFSFLVLFLAIFVLAACTNKVSVEEGTFNITVGEEQEVLFKGVGPEKLIFESLNEDVVLVDENGVYVGVGPGLSTITVKHKKKEWSLYVVVTGEKITINAAEQLEINVNSEHNLVYQTNDENGVTFESSDESILKINDAGVITALEAGTANVVIKSKTNYKLVKTVSVRVLGINEILYDINVVKTLTMDLFSTQKLTVVTDDSTGVTFTSLDSEKLTVDAEGNMEALVEGIVNVKVASKLNPNAYEIVTVTIVDNRAPEEINFTEAVNNTLNLTNYTLEFYVNENFENINYYYTILLMFNDNVTKIQSGTIEEYYEVVDGNQYVYRKTTDGFVRETTTTSGSDGYVLYENFTFDAFSYNDASKKYSLNAADPKYANLLDDFISLFTEDGVVLNFQLSVKEGYIDKMEFIFVYEDYVFSITITIKDISSTVVEVPKHA
ncbi:MAG: Ig-like domain-containing protein [Acholeplasmatales bacterium]|jgi:hypothetical protein|nr:hypothetical protein [Bacillota bacterium]